MTTSTSTTTGSSGRSAACAGARRETLSRGPADGGAPPQARWPGGPAAALAGRDLAGRDLAAARAPRSWLAPPPVEAYVLHAPDSAALAATASRIADLAPSLSDAELHDLACQLGRDGCAPGGVRLGIVASGQQQLAVLARQGARLVPALKPGELVTRPGIFASSSARGRVVLLFPGLAIGQDSAGESAACTPPPLFGLTDPQAVQPAILHASLSGLRWLDRLGVTAAAAVGHSLGEITGLVWAGCLPETEATRLVAQRSAVITASGARQTAMLSVAADAATSRALCAGTDLVIAAYNGPGLHVLAGSVTGVREATRRAEQQGIRALVLDVSHAFHSPAMAGCAAPLRSVLADVRFGPPRRRLVSTVIGRELSAADDIPALLCAALTSPVRFTDALAAAAAEADLLCETGPGHALAALAAAGCKVPAVSLEARTGDDRGPAHAAAALFAAGAVHTLEPMLAGRSAQPVDIWQERIVLSAAGPQAAADAADREPAPAGVNGTAPLGLANGVATRDETTATALAVGTRPANGPASTDETAPTGRKNAAATTEPVTANSAGTAEPVIANGAGSGNGAGTADGAGTGVPITANGAGSASGTAVPWQPTGLAPRAPDAHAGAPAADVIPIGNGAARAIRSAGTTRPPAGQPDRTESPRPALRGRFLEQIRRHRPGAELIADSRISLDSDPYLADYLIDGLPVLPAAMALEAMAQAGAALAGRPVLHARQVSFAGPIVIRPGTVIRVCAKREGKRVTTVLRGRHDGQWTDHCRAVFPARAAEAPPGQPSASAAGRPAGSRPGWRTAQTVTAILDSADLYGPVCFQAGRFRRVAFLPELTSRRCRALIRGGDDQPWFGAGLADASLQLGSPGLNDATVHVLQACFPYRRVLPAGCDAVTVSGRQVQGAVEVTAMQRSATRAASRRPVLAPVQDPEITAVNPVPPHRAVPSGPHAPEEYVWDVAAVDSTGQAVITWTGLRLRDAGPVPGHPALPPALLGVYLERGATALGLDPALRINVRCEPPPLGPAAAGSSWSPTVAASRRPGWVSARSCGQLDELSLRLRAASPAACAWQTADLQQDAPELERDIEDPEFASLRERLRDTLAEPTPTVHARIRTAIECLSKAGRPVGCELVVDGCYDDGWALLHAGDAFIACTSVRVIGVSSPVAVSIMTGTGAHAAGAA